MASAEVLRLSDKRSMTLAITVSQTTDIFYILRRNGRDAEQARSVIRMLGDNMVVADVTAADYRNAVDSGMEDYEDALLAMCARRIKVDYIVTRNEKDYTDSPVPAISPADFLERFFPPETEG